MSLQAALGMGMVSVGGNWQRVLPWAADPPGSPASPSQGSSLHLLLRLRELLAFSNYNL